MTLTPSYNPVPIKTNQTPKSSESEAFRQLLQRHSAMLFLKLGAIGFERLAALSPAQAELAGVAFAAVKRLRRVFAFLWL
jgi:hypothetical protein